MLSVTRFCRLSHLLNKETPTALALFASLPTFRVAYFVTLLESYAYILSTEVMSVRIETTPTTPLPTSKAHCLKSVRRHASAPTRPSLILDVSKTSEGHQRINKQRPSPSPQVSASIPRSRLNLPNELSIAHSTVSRLRLDRDEWRTTAQLQATQLSYHERDITRQARKIETLQEQNDALRAQHAEVVEDKDTLFTHFQSVITKHDKLVDQLNEANRAMDRLKKSERAKGKVSQRNLRLKATLTRIKLQAMSGPARGDPDNEAALKEALALASERIGDLESRGGILLEALEKRDVGNGSDEADESGALGLVEAELAFRGVLDDEAFKEQKEHWEDLLEE